MAATGNVLIREVSSFQRQKGGREGDGEREREGEREFIVHVAL